MFCPNCGDNLTSDEDFCPKCGTNIKELKTSQFNSNNSKINDKEKNDVKANNSQPTEPTMTEMFSNKSKNFIKPILEKIKTFVIKYKKQLIIGCSCCLVIVLGVVLFNKFYDFTKLSWVKDYGDYNVEYTSSTKIELKAEAFDKEKNQIYGLNYTTKDGTIEIKDEIAYWNLPNEEGTYTIYAHSPSGKKIKKSITLISLEDNNNSHLGGVLSKDIDDNTDSDKDTLTDKKEEELGTNPYSADSDNDGLPDQYEINESKTDPLKSDSDNDGLNDGDELDLSLDPLKADSKGDGIKDGQRSMTYTIDNNELGINIEITGKGNIPSTTIDAFENSTFTDMDGLLDQVYNFYTNGTIESAVVKIKYSLEDIQAKGLNEENLTLYYFNEETKQLEAMPTTIDKKNKKIIVTLNHFSKYVIGDKDVVLTNTKSQIMMVIDNSISMYTYSQLTNLGYTKITGADGNDSEFKRLTLTNKLVDMFTGNYHFGVSQFAGNYVNLKKFTDNKTEIKNAVDSVKNDLDKVTNGTNIVNALKKGISEFSSDDNNHYLILLTDGKDTSNTLSYSKNTIVSSAKEKDVKICVIGLGKELDTADLNEIAESTGCDYYNATNSSALDEIYSIVAADINYNLVDTDGDGKTDGTIIADSGFIVTRDGFSFNNLATLQQSPGGICYGMATFAQLYYRNQLPLTLGEKRIKEFYSLVVGNIDFVSSGYDLNNTYFAEKKNLYNYSITDDAIRLRIIDFPADIRDRVEDGVYYVSDKYYDMFSNIGITYSLEKYKGDIKGIKKYQSVGYLDVENEKLKANGNSEDVQFLKAIWRLYMLQINDEAISFSTTSDKAYSSLYTELKNGNPIVIGIGGNHAVNAIRLIQDNSDSNKFKLEIYDNNYSGKSRYIEVTRSKYSNIIKKWWNSDYDSEYSYTFQYEDYGNKNISVELHYATIE